MPKIYDQKIIEEDEEQEEEKIEEEEKEEGEKETPKFSPSARNNDKETIESAKNIFDKMFKMEEEEMVPEEEDEINPVMIENFEGELEFQTVGKPRMISVFPPNPILKYHLELRDSENNLINTISNLKGPYKATADIKIPGNYRLVIKSNSTGMPFTIKLN